ncbi:hypothetical protein [Nocardioides panacisoli]|nr:hypothetical protein [Nocardioides panacisoli]
MTKTKLAVAAMAVAFVTAVAPVSPAAAAPVVKTNTTEHCC